MNSINNNSGSFIQLMNSSNISKFNANSSIDHSSIEYKFEVPLDCIVFGTIAYLLIFIIGTCGNMMVIYVLMVEKELRNFTNYLLANLSIADLMVLFTCLPAAFHDLFAKERWYLGKAMCYIFYFSQNCMSHASILTIFAITCERYYVICRPLSVKSLLTPCFTLKVIILIWFISLTVNLPFLFLTEYKLQYFLDVRGEQYQCSANAVNTLPYYYVLAFSYAIYFLTAVILLLMYCQISKCLNKSNDMLIENFKNKIKQQQQHTETQKPKEDAEECVQDEENNKLLVKEATTITSSQNLKAIKQSNSNNNIYYKNNECKDKMVRSKQTHLMVSNSKNKSVRHKMGSNNNINCTNIEINNEDFEKYIKPRKQLIHMLMCIIVLFYVCLYPLKIWNLILMFFAHKPSFTEIINLRTYMYVSVTARIFFYMNSSINPILYNCLSKKFRSSFKRILNNIFCRFHQNI
jgi:hypothetical protein